MKELDIFDRYGLKTTKLESGVYKVVNPEENCINITQFGHEFYECSVLATDKGINGDYEEFGNIYYIFIGAEIKIIQEIANSMQGKIDLYFYDGISRKFDSAL